MSDAFRLEDLARLVGGRVEGDPDRRIVAVATLESATPDDLSFLTNVRYRKQAERSRAGAFVVGPGSGLAGRDLLVVGEPYVALAEILDRMHPATRPAPGISADARIAASASIGREVSIAAFAVVGERAAIGDRASVGASAVVGDDAFVGPDTTLHPSVVLYPRTRVGARCILHAGCVLGADGFGFATHEGVHRKIPQLGRVVVEDDVEIGANTTIDRGMLGDTIIGRGSKLDDLVMIAHGVVVGAGALLAAQAGVAGSTQLGRGVTFAGQSGAAGHLRIGDGVVVAAKTAVFQDVPDGAFVAGIPATDHRSWKRAQAAAKSLPEMKSRLRRLEERIAAIEGKRKGET